MPTDEEDEMSKEPGSVSLKFMWTRAGFEELPDIASSSCE